MNAIYMTYRSKRRALRKKGGKHTSRNRRRQRQSLKKGGCGCDNKSIFSGGSNQLGPSPGLDQLPIRSYYDLNTYGGNDPTAPNNVMSVRTQPNMVSGGGKRRRSKSARRSRRQRKPNVMKGGGLFDSWSLLGSDPISNFGNTTGPFNSDELLRGNFGPNPNPSVQPVTQMFNKNHPQIV